MRGLRNSVAACLLAGLIALGVLVALPHRTYADETSGNAPVVPTSAPTKTFTDIPEDHPAYRAITRIATLGIMDGYEDDTFRPSDEVTRADMAVTLWKMAGEPAPSSRSKGFDDVDAESGYDEAVRWASSVGVIDGNKDGTFAPSTNVTHEQLAVMLANYARNVCSVKAKGSEADLEEVYDAEEISSEAVSSVAWCVKRQIMVIDEGLVTPQEASTRADVAMMVVGLYDIVGSRTTNKVALRTYQRYLKSLSESTTIVIDCDGNGLPNPDGEEKNEAMLYAYAVGDFDGDGISELLVCIREDAPDHLCTSYVCKYSKSAGGLVKCAPSISRLVPLEMITCYASGWIELDDGMFMATKDGQAEKMGGIEGQTLLAKMRADGKYLLVAYSTYDSTVISTFDKAEYNRIVSELTDGGILDIELVQATATNIDAII